MFELVELKTMTVSPNRTMLPPIWVAACDSQRRRKPPFRKTASGPLSSLRVRSRRPSRCRPSVCGLTAHGRGHRRVAAADELRQPALQRPAFEQDVAAAASRSADRCRRRADRPARCSPPHGCARRSRTTSPRSSVRTGWSGIGGSGYQSRGRPCAGTRVRVVAGSSSRSDRGDRDARRRAGSRPAGR